MDDPLKSALTNYELFVLSSIVQVGDATYKELVGTQSSLFNHAYFADTRGRIRTKLVQMQCEIESHDPKFPFSFWQRNFPYEQCIPELQTKNTIIHIARSTSPDKLPYPSHYKIKLSNNNAVLCRQLVIDPDFAPPVTFEPFYGMLVFGGGIQTFSLIQFPAPGYYGIADSIPLPQIILEKKSEAEQTFERKKALLKEEFLAHKDLEENTQ